MNAAVEHRLLKAGWREDALASGSDLVQRFLACYSAASGGLSVVLSTVLLEQTVGPSVASARSVLAVAAVVASGSAQLRYRSWNRDGGTCAAAVEPLAAWIASSVTSSLLETCIQAHLRS
jgi:hypothetical protein